MTISFNHLIVLFCVVTCVEFEVSEYAVLESVGLLNVTLILMGETQPVSFNVTVIANDTGSSSATGKTQKCVHTKIYFHLQTWNIHTYMNDI